MRTSPILFGYALHERIPQAASTVDPNISITDVEAEPFPSTATPAEGEKSRSSRILGHLKPLSLNDKQIRKYQRLTAIMNNGQVNRPNLKNEALEVTDVKTLSNAELMAKTDAFKQHLAGKLGVSVEELPQCTDMTEIQVALNEILPEAYTVAREACHRVLAQTPYDVQVMGGMALHEGSIAEMKTGEGKTLTAVLPAYLNALMGKGVHIQTANDYLAQRDAVLMGSVFEALGLSVGLVLPPQSSQEKRKAYQADITYGTTSEMIFDYLRDNMVRSLEDKVNRKGYFYVIADEADKLMLDEALTPHIISRTVSMSQDEVVAQVQAFYEAAALVERLKPGKHYEVNERERTVKLTDAGEERVAMLQPDLSKQFWVSNALKAKALYHRDRDYIVQGGKVLIVDSQTGRILHGRQWNDGIQQAVEAKEILQQVIDGENNSGRLISWSPENLTAATIGYRSFFMLYQKKAGMTGTAKTSEAEFNHLYNLPVWQIPTHKPFIRIQLPDILCKDKNAKFDFIAKEIRNIHKTGHGTEGEGLYATGQGRPIVVGTGSVEDSEELSRRLTALRLPHQVLNAKSHEKEAGIIAQAGRKGAITVATNMAGRGTDIKLGGDPKAMTEEWLRRHGITPNDPAYLQQYDKIFAGLKKEMDLEAKDIKKLGGLYVIGTERARSRRVDNQLAGRGGRQGDPSAVRFITSIEDDTTRPWINPVLARVFQSLFRETPYLILEPRLQKKFQDCQKKIEIQDTAIRKHALELDMELNLYRHSFYENRDAVLGIKTKAAFAEALTRMTARFLEEAVHTFGGDYRKLDALTAATTGVTEANRAQKLAAFQKALSPHSTHETGLSRRLVAAYFELNREMRLSEILETSDDPDRDLADLTHRLVAKAMNAWDVMEARALSIYRSQCLNVTDNLWQAFLSNLDEMADSKALYVYSQQNPDIFYIREVGRLFQQENSLIAFETLQALSQLTGG